MTGAMPTAGLSQLTCKVVSIQGDTAKVRDQLNREITVRRDIARAKAALPQVGEQWIIARDLMNQWTFAAIVGLDTTIPPVAPDHVYEVADGTERDAIDPHFLYAGMTIYRRDVGYHEVWTPGSPGSWNPAPRVGVIKHVDPTTDLSFTSSTVDTPCQVTFTKVAGREYEVGYTTRFSQTTVGGTVTVNFRSIAGTGPILVSSSSFLNYTVVGNGGNNAGLSCVKYLPPTYSPGVYTIGVTVFSGSGGGASIAYGGTVDGRSFYVKDMGISQQ